MFRDCSKLEQLDISRFKTSKVTNMRYMFSGCSSLNKLDISSFDTSKVTDMSHMFAYCSGLSQLDISSFNTSEVTHMGGMFYTCLNISTIYASNKFNVDNVIEGDSIFYGCNKLTGAKGTKYGMYKSDIKYARIDGGSSNPGYFTQTGFMKDGI